MTKRKKKIAIFHCGFIYSGGGERIVLEEAKGLRKKGYEVEVYAPTYDPEKCYPEMTREVGVKMFLPTFIEKLPFRNAIRMIATSFLAPIFAYKFKDVDVFVGANQPGAWVAYCCAKFLKKPYLVYLNHPNRFLYPRPVDSLFGWYTTVKDYQFLYRLIQLGKRFVAIADRVSVTSAKALLVNGSYIGGVIENVYAKRVIDTPAGSYFYPENKLGFNPHSVFLGKTKVGKKIIKKPYILITNRHDPQKRFDYAIRAMKIILKEYPFTLLVIPGPLTGHSKELIKLSKKLKISDKVLFLGQISEHELQRLYKYCVVYCYPSPEEDFGLGPLEAGGWGVPTVAWRHGGPTVTVEESVTGFLAEPYSVKDYAYKILTLLNSPELRAKMSKAAWKRTKEKFSWDNHVDILEREILKVI